MEDGTKSSWIESFDLGLGMKVKTGSLQAKANEIRNFANALSILDKEIALRDYLLASAENRISVEEYHYAILESIISLEITLSEYFMIKARKIGIPKKRNPGFN
jgi:hypothetical protein